MEEKERYKLESYHEAFCEIHDTESDEWYIRKDLITDLLNQQDKRIKELEEQVEEYQQWADKEITKLYKENQQLKQQLEEIKQNCNYQVMLMCSKENALLKQQIHDLPKKIVKDVRDVAGDYWDYEMCEECGNIIDFHTLSKKDFDEVLATILEKYGVEK